VESDEGREVVLDFVPALLGAENPFELLELGELPTLRLRMTNAEAAELFGMLDGAIGEWAREFAAAKREYEQGEGRADFDLWPGEADLLDPLDPKHPRYAEHLADLGDARRAREREEL
jgi:hypothetical protein